MIKVALLDDDESSGHGSPDGYAAWTGTYTGDPNEEISALRVSAIRTYSIPARVGVAYMSKETEASDWDIKAFTLEWDSEDEENFPNSSVTQSAVTRISEEDDNETDDYSPDIAFDPLTGLMHIVWTGYTGAQYDHPYKVFYSTWDGENEPSDPVPIFDDGTDYACWAPRIAIGGAGIDTCNDIVGIVYSAYSDEDEPEGVWHPAAAYWDVDTEDYDDARFMHLVYMDDEHDAAGYPRLALAPRASNDYYGSIVFTQYDETYGTYETIEINNVRNDYWVVEGYRETADEEFNGAVAMHYNEQYPTASISHLEQAPLGTWDVTAGRYRLQDSESLDTWLLPVTGIGGGDLVKFGDFIDFLEIETFQMGDIVTVNSDNSYWIGYCDKIDSQAYCVRVFFGNTSS